MAGDRISTDVIPPRVRTVRTSKLIGWVRVRAATLATSRGRRCPNGRRIER
jgi:hypothetical protein